MLFSIKSATEHSPATSIEHAPLQGSTWVICLEAWAEVWVVWAAWEAWAAEAWAVSRGGGADKGKYRHRRSPLWVERQPIESLHLPATSFRRCQLPARYAEVQ